MFGFGWLFDPIRKKVAKAMDRALKRQFGKFIDRLEGITKANVKTLADTIADSDAFQAAGIPSKWLDDRITNTQLRESIDLKAVPLDSLETSAALSSALAKRLADSSEVKAWANDLGMTPAQVAQVLNDYSGPLVRYGIRDALERLRKGQTSLYADFAVLGVEDGDAYEIAGDTRHRSMIRFADRRSLEQARQFWKRRERAGFKYEKNVYKK